MKFILIFIALTVGTFLWKYHMDRSGKDWTIKEVVKPVGFSAIVALVIVSAMAFLNGLEGI